MKKKIVPIIIILLIVGAIGEGYWHFSQHPDQLTQLQVKLGLMTPEEAQGIQSASGFIEATEVEIVAETKGRIVRLTVDEGDFVEMGQILVELDTDLLQAEMGQAEAKIRVAEAQLARVEAGTPADDIAVAQAAVAVAEAEAEAAAVRLQNSIMLRDNPQELDMQIDAAKTELERAELRVALAIPLKDAGEALWELHHQQWDRMQEGIDWSVKLPGGRKKSGHYDFPEGEKQQAGVSWNMAGASRWEAWVNLNSAMAAREDTEATLQELQQLRNDPVEAQLQVDEAEAAYRAAQADVEVAKANLAQLQAGPRAEQVALTEAQVQQAETAMAALEVDRQKHVLVAPVSGWVAERVAQEGEMASPGTPLMTVADLSEVTLTIYVPEPDIDTIALGQEIEVFVDTFPNKPFTGHITFINDKAEFTPKNVQTKEERMTTVFAVEIKLDNPDQELKPGMPADAILSEGPEL